MFLYYFKKMHFVLGLLFIVSMLSTGYAIDCYRCNSSQTLDCLEKFLNPNPLRPESCADVSGAQYCIKTTGIYNGVLGAQRFCSPKDLGNFCESFVHTDGREYRGCVYTCHADGCNGAHSSYKVSLTNTVISATILVIFFKLHSAFLR